MNSGMNMKKLYHNECAFEETVNENFYKIESFETLSIETTISSSSTEDITPNALYLIANNTDPILQNKNNQIACYNKNLGWLFYIPKIGSIGYLKNKKYFISYNGTEWEQFDTSGEGTGTTNYNKLTNKPSINSIELSGDKTASDLNLQNKLTAGANITIENNVISATGEYNVIEPDDITLNKNKDGYMQIKDAGVTITKLNDNLLAKSNKASDYNNKITTKGYVDEKIDTINNNQIYQFIITITTDETTGKTIYNFNEKESKTENMDLQNFCKWLLDVNNKEYIIQIIYTNNDSIECIYHLQQSSKQKTETTTTSIFVFISSNGKITNKITLSYNETTPSQSNITLETLHYVNDTSELQVKEPYKESISETANTQQKVNEETKIKLTTIDKTATKESKNLIDSNAVYKEEIDNETSSFTYTNATSSDKLNITINNKDGKEILNKSIDLTDKIIFENKTQTLTNKTINCDKNIISNINYPDFKNQGTRNAGKAYIIADDGTTTLSKSGIGQVDDVKINNKSIIKNRVANIKIDDVTLRNTGSDGAIYVNLDNSNLFYDGAKDAISLTDKIRVNNIIVKKNLETDTLKVNTKAEVPTLTSESGDLEIVNKQTLKNYIKAKNITNKINTIWHISHTAKSQQIHTYGNCVYINLNILLQTIIKPNEWTSLVDINGIRRSG